MDGFKDTSKTRYLGTGPVRGAAAASQTMRGWRDPMIDGTSARPTGRDAVVAATVTRGNRVQAEEAGESVLAGRGKSIPRAAAATPPPAPRGALQGTYLDRRLQTLPSERGEMKRK